MRIDAATGRRRRPISVTSLIDVIFLLLLFFMLSSTFAKFAEVEITGGRAGQGAGGVPDVIIRLVDEDWSVNGLRLPRDAALAELVRLQDAGAASAVILVREGLTSQALVGAVEAIRGSTRFTLQVAR